MSWRSENMRRYFECLENCRYRWLDRLIRYIWNPTRHGWDGWLYAEQPLPLKELLRDQRLIKILVRSVVKALAHERRPFDPLKRFFYSLGDPNDWRLVSASAEGQRFTPLTTMNHRRMGTRERVFEVACRYPGRLKIVTDALATRVIFDDDRAVPGRRETLQGVQVLVRAHR